MSAREIKELINDHKRHSFRRNTPRLSDRAGVEVDQNIDTLDDLLKSDKIKKRFVYLLLLSCD